MSAPNPEAERILNEISSLLSDLHAGSGGALNLESDLVSDLGLDSLSLVELLDRLEQTFGVQLSEETLMTATTPADWLNAILEASGKAPKQNAPMPLSTSDAHAATMATAGPPDAHTLVDALAWHVRTHPDRLHIKILGQLANAADEPITYRMLADEATAFAQALLHGGIAPGERIAIMLPTARAYFTTFLGILIAGGVPVPIYPPARLAVLEQHLTRQARLLNNAGVVALVTVPEAKIAARLLRSQVLSLRAVWTTDAMPEPGSQRERLPRLRGEDIALIQYTSGSTGDPKGVVLTHAQLLANISAMGRAIDISTSDVFVSWLPLYHDMGLIGAWLAPMVFGFPLVVMSPLHFLARPARWLEAITAHGGTISAAPNFAFHNCVERIREHELVGLDLSSWRVAFNGSEPVSAATTERFIERFSKYGFARSAMCPAYGLAEIGVGVAFTPLGHGPHIDTIDPDTLHREGRAKSLPSGDPSGLSAVSCGTPLPGYDIRVCDTGGTVLADRLEGSVECRGPSVTSGYFANETANRALWHEGWLVTGDLGYLVDGELFLTGRRKDLIIRAGRNIHPEELEEVIGALDGIHTGGVAVFAVSDPRRATERLVVVAETDFDQPPAREELRHSVVGQTAKHVGAAPDDVVLVAPGTILRTASGKIQRSATRDAYLSDTLGRHPNPVALQVSRFALSGIGTSIHKARDVIAQTTFSIIAWTAVISIGVPLWFVVHLPLPASLRWGLARLGARSLQAITRVRLTQTGASLHDEEPAVIVANHPSFIDGVVMCLCFVRPVAIVASSELERQPIVGSFLRRIGCLFVERGRVDQTAQVVGSLGRFVREGHRLVIFPEGSLARAPGLRPFHLGAFAIADAARCPVIPVGIRGSRDVVRPGTRRPRRAPIAVAFGPPLWPSGTGFAAQVDLRDAARRAVGDLSNETDIT